MVRHLFVLGALLIASSGRLLAEASPLQDLALEIVQRQLGAPVNARHDAIRRLRSPTDPPVEAVV